MSVQIELCYTKVNEEVLDEIISKLIIYTKRKTTTGYTALQIIKSTFDSSLKFLYIDYIVDDFKNIVFFKLTAKDKPPVETNGVWTNHFYIPRLVTPKEFISNSIEKLKYIVGDS